MSSKHQDFLSTHCRVCGKGIGYKYNCCKHKELLRYLGIDPTSDNSLVHPDSFCNSCYLTAKKICASSDKQPSRKPIDWLPHDDVSCSVCDCLSKGGRPKRKISSGRPTHIQQHIKSVASVIPVFNLSQLVDDKYKVDVTCNQCNLAANKPVEIIPCKAILCCSCCVSLATQAKFNCPSCSIPHNSALTTFTRPSSRVEKLFKELLMKCEKCECKVKLEWIEKECAYHREHQSLTLQDIVNQPQALEREPSNLEKRAAMKVMSRMLHQSDSATVTFSTGGRVSSNIQ